MPDEKNPKDPVSAEADDVEKIDSSGIGEAVGDDAEDTDEEAEVEGHMFGGVLKPGQLRPASILQNTATVNLDNMYTLYGGLADPLGEISQRPEQR